MGHGTAVAVNLGVSIAPGLAPGSAMGLTLGALVVFGVVLALGVVGWRQYRAVRQEIATHLLRAARAERFAAADVDPVFIVDRDGSIRDRNAAAVALAPVPADGGQESLARLVRPADAPSLTDLLDAAVVRREPRPGAVQVHLRQDEGRERSWDVTAILTQAPNSDSDSAADLIVRLRDISEEEALRAELAALRLHDPITGLPSQTLFMDRLGHALTLAARRAEVLGVFVIDTDLSLAGAMAEAARATALSTIAQRIQLALRHGDSVAHLDGTRFAVLLESLHDVLDAAAVAERLLDRFHSPVSVGGAHVAVVPMIGMALSGGHERPEELIEQSEAALAAVRRGPFAPYAIYDPSMTIAAIDDVGLEKDLRRAFSSDELQLHYQPVVRLSDEAIVAYEATPVWRHPRRGLISTAELTGAAEASGLMLPLGLWTLVTACRQLVEWIDRRDGEPPVICLDVSRRLFHHSGLAGDVARVLHEAGVRPHLLRLAIAQSIALNDVNATVTRLEALKGVGVQVAISEFGTGYAALGFFQRCPVDCLKIAATYVAGLGRNPDDSAIVKAALAFAKGLEIQVIAEGIETAAQRDELRRWECAYGQGDLFGAAVLPKDVATPIPSAAAGQVGGITNEDDRQATTTGSTEISD